MSDKPIDKQNRQYLKVVHTLNVLSAMKEGEIMKVEGFDYPIAMGEDGRVGFLYAGRVVDNFTMKDIVEICQRVKI